LKNELIRMFESPRGLSKKKVFELCAFFKNNYATTTLFQLVKVLVNHKKNAKLPYAIITFNADSLLHSLITIFTIKNQYEETKTYTIPKENYKKVTRTIQDWAGTIPIFHLHGSISPTAAKGISKDTRDSLIFLESSYNEVANNMYSWAQSTFLYHATNNKLVFIGLSMSDPNIRKWLSWTNQNYLKDLNIVTKKETISLPHLWIKTKSHSDEIQEFMDISLRHMGVKIGLIDDYQKTEEILNKIM
jgi:hypothetical protein